MSFLKYFIIVAREEFFSRLYLVYLHPLQEKKNCLALNISSIVSRYVIVKVLIIVYFSVLITIFFCFLILGSYLVSDSCCLSARDTRLHRRLFCHNGALVAGSA